jgi:hypothetical protein
VQDSVFVHPPDGCALAAPILPVRLARQRHPTVTHPRVRRRRCRKSRQRHRATPRPRFADQRRHRIVVGPGRLAHHKVQREDVAAYHLAAIAAAGGDGRLTSRAIALGAGLRSAIATR